MFHQNSLKFLGVSLYIILKTNEGICNLTVHSRKIQCTYFVHNIVFFCMGEAEALRSIDPIKPPHGAIV